MAAFVMMQGDSYAVPITLKMRDTGDIITPGMVSEIEVCVGQNLRKIYSSGQVLYDATQLQWYFVPTQQETFDLEPDTYEVQARVKLLNGPYSDVIGTKIGYITIIDASSEKVI